MSKCPTCGKHNGLWNWRDACKCDESDMLDGVLKASSAWNWMDEVIDLAKPFKNAGKVVRYVNGERVDGKK